MCRTIFAKSTNFWNRNVGKRAIRIIPVIALAYYILPISLDIEVGDLDPEKEALSEDGIELEEGEEDDEEEGEEMFFLPLSWPKLADRVYYKGSDPEWQEYIKLSKDKPKQSKIFCKCYDHHLDDDDANLEQLRLLILFETFVMMILIYHA